MSDKKTDHTLSWTVLCCLVVALNTEAAATEALHVHAGEFPCPAVRAAAKEFSQRYGVRVDVDSATRGEWPREAEQDADVIFATSESRMADLIQNAAFGISEAWVTPLYLRPASIFVRPGNPHGIRSFSDLLRSDIRIMVVNDPGRLDLWQDAARGDSDAEPLLVMLRNAAVFAPTNHEALQIWRQRTDVDVWVKWDYWHKPPHYSAERVKASTEPRLYQRCCLALTRRGNDNPLAKQFVDFLISPPGEEIFESWHWMPTRGKSDLVVVNLDRQELHADKRNAEPEPSGAHGGGQNGGATQGHTVGGGR